MQVAIEHEQHDTAFEIYRKGGYKVEALTVLTDRVRDLNRAHEYATKVDDAAVWSTLGHKQLEQGHVTDAIGSYILAKDSSKYMEVTAKAKVVRQYDDLVRYLMMVRDKVKDPKVDTEIVIGYAMTDKLGDLESFITSALCHRENVYFFYTGLTQADTCAARLCLAQCLIAMSASSHAHGAPSACSYQGSRIYCTVNALPY